MFSVLLLGLFLMSQAKQAPVAQMDGSFVDWVAANSSRPAPAPHVVLVEINDNSLGADHPWPWSPLEFALFMRSVLPFGPTVIAVEPVLNWEDSSAKGPVLLKQQQYQKILHDYILQAPKIVLGSQLGFPDDPEMAPPLQQAPVLRNVKGDAKDIPEFTLIDKQPADDLRLSPATGFVNTLPEGGIAHTLPLVFRYHGQIVPSLALQTAILWFKLTPDDVTVQPGAFITLGTAAKVPIDSAGRMRVDFNSPITRFGYDDLLLAVDQQQDKQHPSAISLGTLKGSAVVLARTDRDTRTLTFPNESKGSAGELCARAVSTIQNKEFVRRVPYVFDFILIAVAMVVSCFFHRLRKRTVAFFSLATLICYLFTAMSIYGLALIWLPFALPLGLLLLVNFFSLFTPRAQARASQET